MSRLATLLGVLLLLAGEAAAASATASLRTAEEVHLEGRVLLLMEDPQGGLRAPATTDEIHLRNATGTLTLWTWNATSGDLVGPVSQQVEDAKRLDLPLEGEDLVLAIAGEEWYVGFAAVGRASVSTAVAAGGRPAFAPSDASSTLVTSPAVFARPEGIEWTVAEGAPTMGGRVQDSFPLVPERARLVVDGELEVELFGGNLTWDESSAPVRLGHWPAGAPEVRSPLRPRVAPHETWRQAIFRGTGELDVPTTAHWQVGGTSIIWRVDGVARWTGATGDARADGGHRSFEGATLELAGAFDVRPSPGSGPADAFVYVADGDATAHVNGALVAGATTSPRIPGAMPIALATAILAAFALAWKLVGLLYTRITPATMLAHPTRRRIHDVVAERPGLTASDLHRAVGGAWGPFTFHMRLMIASGFLRTAREGRLRRVFPVGTPPDATAQDPLLHPLARALLDALPATGVPVAAADLRVRVGASRQLVEYHLGRLLAAGLVRKHVPRGRKTYFFRERPAEATRPGGGRP